MIKKYLLVSCASGALLATAPAWAAGPVAAADKTAATPQTSGSADPAQDQTQTSDDDQNAPRRGKARVEERDVVVTGSRAQKILQLPQSKSIINAEDRNLAGVGDIRTLIQVQPGFNYSDAFGLNVRGVGRQTAQTLLGQENTVIQYVDGFINLVPSNIAESTLYGGNIQFIRGPSGTTGGRNSLAGSVNLLSRAPTATFTGEVEAGFGRAGYSDIGANIAGPITSNLGFRVGIQEFSQDSINDNLGTTLDSKRAGFAAKNRYIEFQVEWRPGRFHFRNRLTTFEYDNQPGYATIGRYNNNLANGTPAAVFGGLAPNPQYGYTGPTPNQPYQINVNFAGYDRLRNNLQDIFNADVDLGFASLVYVGGYQRYTSTGSADNDATSRLSYDANTVAPGNFFGGTQIATDYRNNYENHNYFYSNEVRLESKPVTRGLSWVAGYYNFYQHFNEYYHENIFNYAPVNAAAGFADALLNGGNAVYTFSTANGVINPSNPDHDTFQQRNIYVIKSNAVFGNIVYDFSDHLRFDGGLRYTWDDKHAITNFRYIYSYPPFFANDVSPAIHGATPEKADRGISGRAALAWRFTPGSEIYITYQRGYQASAFTLGQGLPPNNIAGKENLDVYEIGGFATVSRFRFDASVFYQNFFEQQIPISARNPLTTTNPMTGVTTTGLGPVFTQFVNAPLSRIYGTELQVTWRPNDHSNIVASYTYLNPTFRRFTGPVDITQTCPAGGVITAGGLCTTNPLYGAPQNLAGNDVPRTPRNKLTFYGYYGINLGAYGYIYPGANLSYQTKQYASAFNSNNFTVPARAIAGLTLTYRSPGEHLDITGTVSNLFNNAYADNLAVAAFGSTTNTVTSYGAPRFYTVTARYRF